MKAEITYFSGVLSIAAAFVVAGNVTGALVAFGAGLIMAAIVMSFPGWD